MRGRRGVPPLCLAALLALGACAHGEGPDPRRMSFARPVFSPPASRRVVLENGTVLHLLADHEIPLVTVKVLVRAGSVLDPEGGTGLAEMTGRLLRAGGTRDYPVAAMNGVLEEMGAYLETEIGRESASATLSVLSGDLDKGLELLAQVLRFPVFDEEEMGKVRNRMLEEIRRSDDDPDEIAFRAFRAAVYGGDPRGRTPTAGTLAALGRHDVSAFHKKLFKADRAIAGVSGDFEEQDLLALWRKHFGSWDAASDPPPVFPVPTEAAPPGVHLVRKDFPQAMILSGHLAPPIDSPDYYAFSLMNYILGGAGFNSRLTGEIRSNRGLAYSVGSWYRGDVGYGVFVAYCKTAPATAVEAARLMRGTIDEVSRGGVTERELLWARESVLNSLIFSLESPAEIVERRMSQEYDGLPPDFLERLPGRFEAVTLEEVREAARRHLLPMSSPLVVVGEVAPGDLAEFGQVREIPLTVR